MFGPLCATDSGLVTYLTGLGIRVRTSGIGVKSATRVDNSGN